jgi:predicted DNA-binding protein
MAISPTIGVRLDPQLIEQLDAKAQRTGHTRASPARDFIRAGLPITPRRTMVVESQRDLEADGSTMSAAQGA